MFIKNNQFTDPVLILHLCLTLLTKWIGHPSLTTPKSVSYSSRLISYFHITLYSITYT